MLLRAKIQSPLLYLKYSTSLIVTMCYKGQEATEKVPMLRTNVPQNVLVPFAPSNRSRKEAGNALKAAINTVYAVLGDREPGRMSMTPTLDGTQRPDRLATGVPQLTVAWEKSQSAVDRQFELHFNAITRTSICPIRPLRPLPVGVDTLHPEGPLDSDNKQRQSAVALLKYVLRP